MSLKTDSSDTNMLLKKVIGNHAAWATQFLVKQDIKFRESSVRCVVHMNLEHLYTFCEQHFGRMLLNRQKLLMRENIFKLAQKRKLFATWLP
jgi:hypothetical protein